MSRKYTTEEFIEMAKEANGDYYIYTDIIYRGRAYDVEIICPKHGKFIRTAGYHLRGFGCPKCNKRFRPTTKEYIEMCRKVHGDRYDYSKVEYTLSVNKITIICSEHGEFKQNAGHHLRGQGCPKCKRSHIPTTDEYIERFKSVHGDKYNYSLVEYVNKGTPVKIICREHGVFEQTPGVHWRGHGCSKCVGLYSPTTKEYIERCREVHGDKYDYSKVEYRGNKKKITIICPIHGEFEQRAAAHLGEHGCFRCSPMVSKMSQEWLDSLNIPKEHRETTLILENGRRVVVDAFDPNTNIVYEYDCHFWHGTPEMDLNKIHPIIGLKYKELYKYTINRRKELTKNGYFVVYTYGE